MLAQTQKIILASTSVIRKKILEDAKIDFEVVAPDFDEEKAKEKLKLSPQKLAMFLAKQKALSVSKLYPDAYVVGSDQVCEFLKKEISKSKNAREAILQLTKFSGKTHFQNNAVAVAFNNKIIFQNFSQAKLKMRKISVAEIKKYVEIDSSWNCAGSYKYESLGKHLFSKVEGDYFSILGLAIQPLLAFFYNKKIISIKKS